MTEYAAPVIGLVLVLVVLVILIVTLSGQDDERQSRLRAHRDKRRGSGASVNKRGGGSNCASGPNVGEDFPALLESQSDLVIPPPDEKKIEAVAPRNDSPRHVSIGIR